MPKQPASVDAVVYAQIEPRWAQSSYYRDERGNTILEGAAVTSFTQSRPRKPKPGAQVVKLTLRLPASVFLPLEPEAVVVLRADQIDSVPVQVVAMDPHDYGHARDGSQCAVESCGGTRHDPCAYSRADIVRIDALDAAEDADPDRTRDLGGDPL